MIEVLGRVRFRRLSGHEWQAYVFKRDALGTSYIYERNFLCPHEQPNATMLLDFWEATVELEELRDSRGGE